MRGEGVAWKVLTDVQEFPGFTSSELFGPGTWLAVEPTPSRAAPGCWSEGQCWRKLEVLAGGCVRTGQVDTVQHPAPAHLAGGLRPGDPRSSPQCSPLLCPLWGPSPGPALGGRGTRIGGLSLQLCLGDHSCEPCPWNPGQPPASRPSPHGDGTAQPGPRGALWLLVAQGGLVLWVSR